MSEIHPTSDSPTAEHRVVAALSLTTGSPSDLAEELVEDRRLALRWWLPLFLVGYALFTVLVVGLFQERRPSGFRFAITLTLLLAALALGLYGGVRRWSIESARLRQRHADAVLNRRERLVLLGGIDRGSTVNRTPLPLLTELGQWRIVSAPSDLWMSLGIGGAWVVVTLSRDGFGRGVWSVIALIVAISCGMALVGATYRQRSRCRRFLADSANWAVQP